MTARCDKCGEPADCVNEFGRYLCVDCQWDEAPPRKITCSRCKGEGWLEPIGPCSDGSYITSRECPNCRGDGEIFPPVHQDKAAQDHVEGRK